MRVREPAPQFAKPAIGNQLVRSSKSLRNLDAVDPAATVPGLAEALDRMVEPPLCCAVESAHALPSISLADRPPGSGMRLSVLTHTHGQIRLTPAERRR